MPVSQYPLDLLRAAGAPVRQYSPHSRGWKLRAPHREDKHPSFSIYRVDPHLPDDDPYAWAVMDFAEGLSMGLARYLREYFGYEVKNGKSYEPAVKQQKEIVRKSDLFEEVFSYITNKPLIKPLPDEDHRHILEANIPYRGHGFAALGLDSRKFNIYLDPKDKKPVILYRNEDGQVIGVKKRTGSPKLKYVWEHGKGNEFAFLREKDLLIVVEGEMKAALFAHFYPEADVIGVPSRTTLHKVNIFRYKRVLYVLDPDVANDFITIGMEHLKKLMLAATYLGIGVKIIDFQKAFGVKDINDFVEQYEYPEDLWKVVRSRVKEKARRVRFKKELIVRNMPVFDPKLLPSNALHLLHALLIKVLSDGNWINQCTAEFQVSPLELMNRTGMSKSALYNAIAALRKLGLLDNIPGRLAREGFRSPTFRLSLCKLRKFFLTQPAHDSVAANSPSPHQTTLSGLTSSHVIPPFDIPLTADYHRIFSLWGYYLLVFGDYPIRYFTSYLAGSATRTALRKVRQLTTSVYKGAIAWAKKIREQRQRSYRYARNKVIHALKHAMPGFYVIGRKVYNDEFHFDLPLSALLSGALAIE